MLQSACKGRLSIHRADIMTFYIPEAFPNASSVVRWESNGTELFFTRECFIVSFLCVNHYKVQPLPLFIFLENIIMDVDPPSAFSDI